MHFDFKSLFFGDAVAVHLCSLTAALWFKAEIVLVLCFGLGSSWSDSLLTQAV